MPISIQLSAETEQRLDSLATQTERTKAHILRDIIELGLEDIEDYHLATDVLEQVRIGRESIHSTADLRKDLGLDD